MANYDDIFNAPAQKGTEDKSFVSFNKEEWAAQKKQERESAFAMIDETAQRMANDGSLFSDPIWMCRLVLTATLWAMRF